MSTIEARLVAESVGLPAMWFDEGELFDRASVEQHLDRIKANGHWKGMRLDLSDPQTAFGVALLLDAWERARTTDDPFDAVVLPPGLGEGVHRWTEFVEAWVCWPGLYPLKRMAARLAHIGRDAAVRRALGWEVRAGTLATLEANDFGGWDILRRRGSGQRFLPSGLPVRGPSDAVPEYETIPALAGITNPAEALRVIYEHLVGA